MQVSNRRSGSSRSADEAGQPVAGDAEGELAAIDHDLLHRRAVVGAQTASSRSAAASNQPP